ncbi:MAG TPA: DsbA family protein [Gemmatimonadota bacterium]|jgi:protein-disulfide isomerase
MIGRHRARLVALSLLIFLAPVVPGCRKGSESAERLVDRGPRRGAEPPAAAEPPKAAGPDTTGLSIGGADTLPAKSPGADSLLALAGDAPSMGPAGAAVTLIEFSDFECPFCTRVGGTLRRLLQDRPDVRLVYMQYPILSLHPGAMLPAEASVEAQRQGKFWEFHDALFEHGSGLDRSTVLEIAARVGLDVKALERALDQRTHRARVERDMNIGEGLGITGTPTFFINGYRVVGALPYERFVAIYNLLLRASRRDEIAQADPRP